MCLLNVSDVIFEHISDEHLKVSELLRPPLVLILLWPKRLKRYLMTYDRNL